MTTTCQPALQEAIYARLVADASLTALITGVFDEVTTDVRMPYVVLADVHELASEAHDRGGVDASIVIDVWSTYRGYREVAIIAQEINRVLHRPVTPLAVTGFPRAYIANETQQFMRDPDPDLRRCSTRYRIWLDSNLGE